MVSFTFSAEQVKAAPPDVRRWMENEIVRALSGASPSGATAAPQPRQAPPRQESAESLEHALAAGTGEEMQATFQHISGNSIVARVFFELARDSAFTPAATPFHVVDLRAVLQHLQLSDPKQIFACLNAITQAFQQIRRDSQASLFAFDEAGHIYLHETTYRGIRQVWQQLVAAHPWPATAHMQMPTDFAPVTAASGDVPVEQPHMRPEHAFAGTSND